MEMNILIVKMCPIEGLNSTMLRTLSIIKGLVEDNNKIDILTIPMNNMAVKNSSRFDFLESVRLIHLSHNITYEHVTREDNSTVKKKLRKIIRGIYHALSPFDHTFQMAKSVKLGMLPQMEYDVMITDSDPKTAHIAGKKLIKQGLKYGKWIQYWGDPLSSDITNKVIYPKFVLREIEKKLMDKADKIVYTSPFTLEEQKKIFKKFADRMDFAPTAYIFSEVYEQTDNTKPLLSYTGAYKSDVRDIIPLYKACIDLKDEVNCVITGDSDLELEETDSIMINPRGNADKETAQSDLIICLMNKSGNQIPGKLYHCAATNKKVLVILDGDRKKDLYSFVSKWNRYYICENNKTDIIEAIRCALADEHNWMPLGDFEPQKVSRFIIN